MKPPKVFLLYGAMVLALVAPRLALSADDGAKIFEDECSDCHNGKKKPLDKKQMSRKEWEDAIKTMIEKDKLDPVPSKERRAALVDWLVLTRGPAKEPPAEADGAKAGAAAEIAK
jgi:mono/diheme cytochrome c family protein